MKNKFDSFAGKWMCLETITLTENASERQAYTSHGFWYMRKLDI